jgi:hypothetical protein
MSDSRVFFSSQHETIYSDADFALLVEEFSLPADQLEEIRDHLEDAVNIWRLHGGGGEKRTPPSEERAALNRFATLAKKLVDAHKELPGGADRALNSTFSSAQMAASIGPSATDDPLHKALEFPTTDDEVTFIHLESNDMMLLLDALGNAATSAAETTGQARTGASQDHGLRMWMRNMAIIWEDKVQRSFTRDATDRNDPVSEAAQFCVLAFKYVDPTMPKSRILNAVKQQIQGK